MACKVLLLFFLLPFLCCAQGKISPAKKKQLDSLRVDLQCDSDYIYRFRKIRPYINYHERNSLDQSPRANFYGPQAGVVLFEKHIVGFGAYFSTKKTQRPFEDTDNDKKIDRNVKITYGTLFYQYILIQKRWYELHVPVEAGIGKYRSNYIDSSGNVYRTVNNNNFTLAGGGLLLLLKPFKWLGVSNNFGYRVASEKIVTGFYYSIGVWIGLKPATCDAKYYLFRKKRYRKEVDAILKNN